MRVELEVAREELKAMSCSRMAFLLEAALARLLRALLMESRRPGLRVVVWAELACWNYELPTKLIHVY